VGGLNAIWWSFPIAECVCLFICLAFFRRVDQKMFKPLGDV